MGFFTPSRSGTWSVQMIFEFMLADLISFALSYQAPHAATDRQGTIARQIDCKTNVLCIMQPSNKYRVSGGI